MKALPIAFVLLLGGLLLQAQKSAGFNEQIVRERGQAIVATATAALSTNLMHAITHGGMTNAISFCSVHALPLTDSALNDPSVLLRRVSTRVRNPANQPDGIERRVIQKYQADIAAGKPPAPMVEILQDQARYFSPIVLNNALCLSCHGDPDTQIKPEVRALIDSLYPKDSATGFKLNGLRGIWSVTFKSPPADDSVTPENSSEKDRN